MNSMENLKTISCGSGIESQDKQKRNEASLSSESMTCGVYFIKQTIHKIYLMRIGKTMNITE